METRIELYSSTGRMRGVCARGQLALACPRARLYRCMRAAARRPHGVRARARTARSCNSERGPLRRIRAGNANLLLA
jgi:hypothetical protein